MNIGKLKKFKNITSYTYITSLLSINWVVKQDLGG